MNGKIYYVRHGQSEDNKKSDLKGFIVQTDAPLTDKGKEQARETADKLADVDFDIILVSPLTRTKQTAEIIKGDRDIPMIVESGLEERKGQHGVRMGNDLRDTFRFDYDYSKYPQIETLDDLFDRAERTMKMIETKYAGKTVLVVAHAGYYWGVKAYYKNLPRSGSGIDLADKLKNADYRIYEMKAA